jgi:hypothetical protein
MLYVDKTQVSLDLYPNIGLPCFTPARYRYLIAYFHLTILILSLVLVLKDNFSIYSLSCHNESI